MKRIQNGIWIFVGSFDFFFFFWSFRVWVVNSDLFASGPAAIDVQSLDLPTENLH